MNNLTELTQWQALSDHHREIEDQHMRDWFIKDQTRFARFSLQCGDLLLDYSRNRIQPKTLNLLCELAQASHLKEKIAALFGGSSINCTEKRPALHTALRDKKSTPIVINGENIATLIAHSQKKMCDFVRKVEAQEWKGVTGKPITHIVNIGIGGSYHGPRMCIDALKEFAQTHLQFHFISSVDKTSLLEVLEQIDPESTLFIISSKSFSTLETMNNATTISTWMQDKFGASVLKHQFIAVTSAIAKAKAFGIADENIFPIWEWVGGRYSVWSAIGLPLMLMIGETHFADFLAGAYEMDEHFRHADFFENMPVLLALISIWYMNFFAASAQAIIPYAHRLRYLIPYLQQAEMESNGKNISLNNTRIPYATGPVIFGDEGCNGQHTYHQLLHQGKHLIPVDFILIGRSNAANDLHQDLLIASGLSQAQALMRGKTVEETYHDLRAANYSPDEAAYLAEHQAIPGNRPSNVLFLESLTPKNLGSLLALYEHKIFVQGVIWNINSFDQWGVELGKQLLPIIVKQLEAATADHSIDCATAGLIHHYKKIQGKL